jgi:hypothetical protein
MIKNYVELDESGTYPMRTGANFVVPAGAVEVDFDAIDYALCMFVDGLWEARPAIAAPAIRGGTVTFSQLPDGAIVTVTDIEAGFDLATIAAVDGVVEFELADSAEYLIRADAPLPWMPWEGHLTC